MYFAKVNGKQTLECCNWFILQVESRADKISTIYSLFLCEKCYDNYHDPHPQVLHPAGRTMNHATSLIISFLLLNFLHPVHLYVPIYLGPFKQTSHNVGGDVFVLDEETIYIQVMFKIVLGTWSKYIFTGLLPWWSSTRCVLFHRWGYNPLHNTLKPDTPAEDWKVPSSWGCDTLATSRQVLHIQYWQTCGEMQVGTIFRNRNAILDFILILFWKKVIFFLVWFTSRPLETT